MTAEVTDQLREATPAPKRGVQLHPLSRRIMHWINAVAIIVMIGSGWRIYDYYPALPTDFGFPLYLTLGGDFTVAEAVSDEDGLASALLWHFAAMWVLVVNFLAFVIVGFASGHFRRDFLPVGPRAFLRDFWAALRFKLDHSLGEYNVVHFFGMAAIVAFLFVHIALTLLVPKTLVAMVLGRASGAPHKTSGEAK